MFGQTQQPGQAGGLFGQPAQPAQQSTGLFGGSTGGQTNAFGELGFSERNSNKSSRADIPLDWDPQAQREELLVLELERSVSNNQLDLLSDPLVLPEVFSEVLPLEASHQAEP